MSGKWSHALCTTGFNDIVLAYFIANLVSSFQLKDINGFPSLHLLHCYHLQMSHYTTRYSLISDKGTVSLLNNKIIVARSF